MLSSALLPQVSKGPGGKPTGPAIAAFNDKLYMAWVGHGEGTERIAISSSSNGGQRFDTLDFLPETSGSAPALASFDGRLYIAWAGPGHHLNVATSSDGVTFGTKVTLPETSSAESHISPALASFRGRFFLAWKGTDSRLNTEWSSDGLTFGGKVIYSATSHKETGPALASSPVALSMGWLGPGSNGVYKAQGIASA